MVKHTDSEGGTSYKRGPLSVQEVRALPATTDLVTAGRALGLSRDYCYKLAREGRFPVPVLRAGRHWTVPTAGLWKALGIEP